MQRGNEQPHCHTSDALGKFEDIKMTKQITVVKISPAIIIKLEYLPSSAAFMAANFAEPTALAASAFLFVSLVSPTGSELDNGTSSTK